MSVKAKIQMKNGETVTKLVNDLDTLMLWLMRHHGEYDGFEAYTVKPDEIMQGREP